MICRNFAINFDDLSDSLSSLRHGGSEKEKLRSINVVKYERTSGRCIRCKLFEDSTNRRYSNWNILYDNVIKLIKLLRQ